ncbi:hypothetical protein, partial [Candidatus Synechococcus spongiarum]|uniref:hypothetical protein n=1 Tax=Candidatus Synechococcus spongiarum TaxID=431041 RepID=UPI001C5B9965
VDALTVACTHPGMTQKLSLYWKDKDNPRVQKPNLPPPWETIRNDAEEAVQAIVVSHRVRKKVSGRLHEGTIYGDTGEEETTRNMTYRYVVTREKIDDKFSTQKLERIRDNTIGRIVRDWANEHGGDPKKAFKNSSYPMLGDHGPEIRKVRLRVKRKIVKQQIETMAKASTGYADLGENHHIAIYRLLTGRIGHDVVSLLEASRRLQRREPIVRRERDDGAQFIMSLSKGDSLQVTEDNKIKIRIVRGINKNGQVTIVDHYDSTPKNTRNSPRPKAIIDKHLGKKISVDPVGRIRPAND